MSRRESQRFFVGVTVMEEGGKKPQAFQTQNLSVGGLLIMCDRRWPLGSEHTLALVHDGTRLHMRARVTHFQGGGVGFSFCDPNPVFIDRLQAMLEELAPTVVAPEVTTDRRRTDRIVLAIPVVWSQGEEEHQDRLKDIGQTGAFINTENSPELGASIFMYVPAYTFSRKTALPSEIRGSEATVVRVDAEGFALRFVDASAEFKMALRDLLEGRLAIPTRSE